MSTENATTGTPVESIVHTPGPWEVREVEGLFAITHALGWVLESNSEQQNRADARLIAAAPDLLAACLAFIEADSQRGTDLAFVMAQDAVKKLQLHQRKMAECPARCRKFK